MIIGMFIRYIKTYQSRVYIPLTDGDSFCGLIGENGIGKSSILEALDAFMNGKNWNYNFSVIEKGFNKREPEIIPVFLIPRNWIESPKLLQQAQNLHNIAISLDIDSVNAVHKALVSAFNEQIKSLERYHDLEKNFVLPLGLSYDNNIALAFFGTSDLKNSTETKVVKSEEKLVNNDVEKDIFDISEDGKEPNTENKSKVAENDEKNNFNEYYNLLDFLRSKLEFVYIPKEIDIQTFTKLETEEIQSLMGETLTNIVSNIVTPTDIRTINNQLDSFLNSLESRLGNYCYKTPQTRQQKIKKHEIYSLIIQSFFSTRKLNKKVNDKWIEISSLSSGEKQKAVIDVAYKLIANQEKNKNLILAIDEPDSSLHMSACYDQFDALYEISRNCRQVLFSTHWYGFLPTIASGNGVFITKSENKHKFDRINLANYREQVKQMKEATLGALPFDIRLKSFNDFVQSILTSIVSENSYNWLICEGSSEKIYLNYYLSDLVKNNRLRIVPVGGAPEIKKIYNLLSSSYDDFKQELKNGNKGKVFLLSDTDEKVVDYVVAKNSPNLQCKRVVNSTDKQDTILVDIDSNHLVPTEIEDILNGKVFHKTLIEFKNEHSDVLYFIDENDDIGETASRFALDLKNSEYRKLDEFFNRENIKFAFAEKYCEISSQSNYITPKWIKEIEKFFKS